MIRELPSSRLKVSFDCFFLAFSLTKSYLCRCEPHRHLGRLYQVEYAMEAIGHAGTSLGILASDGIVLAAEKKNINKLLDDVFVSEKIYKLQE